MRPSPPLPIGRTPVLCAVRFLTSFLRIFLMGLKEVIERNTNMTLEELRENIVERREYERRFVVDGEIRKTKEEECLVYFRKGDFEVPICKEGNYLLPLSLENYGKLPKDTLKLIRGLVKRVQEKYAYDVKRANDLTMGGMRKTMRKERKSYWRAYISNTLASILKGKEKKICSEVGEEIRQGLKGLLKDKGLKFFQWSLIHGYVFHDTTVVFDPKSGGWVLLNSLSPTQKEQIFGKEKVRGFLEYMGLLRKSGKGKE